MKQAYVERTGQEPIDFSIGSPNIPPVASIVSEIEKQVAVPENFKYAITELPEMLEAIQTWYQKRYGVALVWIKLSVLPEVRKS